MTTRTTAPRRPAHRIWLLTAAMTGALSPAWATPEKSAKYYEDALVRYEKNDLSGATLQLKNALKEDNKNLGAHLLLGKLMQREGELKAAEAAYEAAMKQGVSKVEVAPLLGQVYLQLGNTRQLLETITPAGLPPSVQAEVLSLRGSALGMSGNVGAAAQAFADARTADPKSALPNIAEAPMLLRTGERDKAKAMALKSTEMAPQNFSAWFQYGTILFTLGEAQAALTAFDKAIALNAKHVDSRVSRASALLSLKRDADAEAELKTLKEAKVKEPRASFLRAMMASNKGQAQAARPDYQEAANLIDAMSPNVRANSEPLLMAGALSHQALGNREKTREYLETLLGRNSKHLAAQMMLAATLMEANELNRAVPLIEGLLRVNANDPQALYMMGTVHMARKQYAQASEFFDKAAKLAPNSPALRDLSFSQLGLGQEKQGLANLERAYAQNPKDTRAAIELAVYYARVGDGKRAIKIAETLVERDPGNLTMLNFLGNVKGRLGDKKGLKEAYDKALAKDPKFRPVVMNMSWYDMEEGRLDPARARLKAFLKDNPKDPDVLFQLGALEQSARKLPEAIAYWTEADSAQQKDPRPALALVDVYLGERQTEKGLAAAKSLVARYGELPQAQMALARAYLVMGDTTLARQTLQEATAKAGFDADTLLTIGRMQMQTGNFDGATHAANKALQSSPNDPAAMGLLVEVAARRGVPAEVDKAMAALQAKNPNHPITTVTAGHIAFSRGQFPKAIGLYKGLFDREPSTSLALNLAQAYAANKEPEKGVAFLESWTRKQPRDLTAMRALADMQLFSVKSQEAKTGYDALVKANPNDPILLAAYARVLFKLNDPAALAMAERAYKMAPDNTPIADAYGWALVQRGNADAGVRVLREARLREPSNATLRWHLAAALSKAGKKNEAKDELRAALSGNPAPSPSAELDQLKAELGL
jgi:putative PEP-CTERM system TPR-repeat lipoprotein